MKPALKPRTTVHRTGGPHFQATAAAATANAMLYALGGSSCCQSYQYSSIRANASGTQAQPSQSPRLQRRPSTNKSNRPKIAQPNQPPIGRNTQRGSTSLEHVCRGLSKSAASAGLSVSELKAEMTV